MPRPEKKLNLRRLKEQFQIKFPESSVIPILISLPDEIDLSELIGQSLILLEILDEERHNNRIPKNIKEV